MTLVPNFSGGDLPTKGTGPLISLQGKPKQHRQMNITINSINKWGFSEQLNVAT